MYLNVDWVRASPTVSCRFETNSARL
uniref:Uncharacterized protein n=1 Tax=Anguilla anguilla TaxID=7936 RepID=A0A0E9PFL6_ANGAN